MKGKLVTVVMLILLLANVITLVVVVQPVKSNPATTISVDPPTTTVRPNTNFNVNIDITDVTDLVACSVVLEWDPSLLVLVNVARGSFWGSEWTWSYDETHPVGAVFFVCFDPSGVNPISGSGILAELQFQGIALGQCEIVLSHTSLISATSNLILTPPYLGDATGDRIVDLPDMFLVVGAFEYNPYNANADFDLDGRVDAFDLWCVIINFNHGYDYDPYAHQPVRILHEVSNGNVNVEAVHDVSVTDVFLWKPAIGEGYRTTIINVTVQNQGDFPETFNVSVTYNGTAVPVELWWDGANTETFHGMGDVNRDGYVDYWDAFHVAAAFGSVPGNPGWNPDADLNNDGVISILDALIVSNHYGSDIWTTLSTPKFVEDRKPVTLAVGESAGVLFRLNTTGFAKGFYVIEAYAEPVMYETDTADNSFFDGLVKVTIPGDVSDDEQIWADMQDISMLAAGFQAQPGVQVKFRHQVTCDDCPHSPNCDVNSDLSIDMADIQFAIDNFWVSDP